MRPTDPLCKYSISVAIGDAGLGKHANLSSAIFSSFTSTAATTVWLVRLEGQGVVRGCT